MGRHSLPIDFRIAYSGNITINHWGDPKVSGRKPDHNRPLLFSGRYNSVASAEGLQVDERLR